MSVASLHILPTFGNKTLTELTVADVDRLLSVKTDHGYSTSTVRRIRAVLSQCLDQGVRWGVVFTSTVGTPIDPRNLNRDFKRVCANAGLGNWHPHELRHSAASLMLAQGIKIQVVSQVLGHASIRMTADVYGHIMDPDRAGSGKRYGRNVVGRLISEAPEFAHWFRPN
jgi:hypothetical protein